MKKYLETSKQYKKYSYKEIDPGMLEYLHKRTLEMARIVVDLFEKNGIHYMICGGTLLGAVTTGKFIPWDDDFDMCVLDDDYDAAKKLLLNNLPDNMILQCTETEPNYYHGWLKVRDKNSKVFPPEPMYSENGVWIDLYRLKEYRNKELKLYEGISKLKYFNRRYKVGGITAGQYFKRVVSNKLVSTLIAGLIKKYLSGDKSKVYLIESASKVSLEPGWCLPSKTYVLEGYEFQGFSDAGKYLEKHYGSTFKTVPEEELRRIGLNRVEIINSMET